MDASGWALWGPVLVSAVAAAWAIGDMLRYPAERWALVGHRRGVWIGLVVVLVLVGVVLYAATVRHQLRQPERYLAVDGVAPADR